MSLSTSVLILISAHARQIQESSVTVCFLLFIPIKYLSILLSFAMAVGLYSFFHGLRLLARERSLFTLPSSKIRGAVRGLVEIGGLAAGPRTMLAPITGEPCFLYRTTAWQQREGKKIQWEKVADETRHLPFFLDDSTGQLLIEATGADLDLHPRFGGEYAASLLDLDHVPQSVSGFLSRHGITLDRNLRIEERLIKADDALFVAGTVTENPDVQARPSLPRRKDHGGVRDHFLSDRNQYRRTPTPSNSLQQFPAPEIVRLAGSAAPSSTREMSQQAKIAAALTRAGVKKPQARAAAAGVPHQAVAVEQNAPPAIRSSGSRSDVRLHDVRLHEVRLREARPDETHPDEDRSESFDSNFAPPVVLMKGTNDPTFVISFRSQKEIVSATAWKAAALVGGGTAVALLSFYMLWVQIALL